VDLKVGAKAFKVNQKVLGRQKWGQVSREVRKMGERRVFKTDKKREKDHS
jgi:hypothetical protein